MTAHTLKLRLRRIFRLRRRQVENISVQAGESIDKDIIGRLDRFSLVWRFITGWILLLLLLIAGVIIQVFDLSNYYQHLAPTNGGVYTEGILGDFSNLSPLYATSNVDRDVSQLIFASLFKYNDQNQLIGDLAQNWQVDAQGRVYTVTLKPNLVWQDGKPLTASDVVYTYQAIESPDAASPLFNSWQGISVKALDSSTVTFTLPNPLASFPYSLTNGIVPKHLLSNVSFADLRSSPFNSLDPIGAGPFSFKTVAVEGATPETRQTVVELLPFDKYHDGRPKLDGFIVRSIHDQANLIQQFKDNKLNGILGPSDFPSQLKSKQNVIESNFILTAAAMTFFKTSSGPLSDVQVRQALVKGANIDSIIASLGYPTRLVNEPILQSQLGYDPSLKQSGYDPAAANAQLDSAGWAKGAGGIRYKNNQPLKFSVTAESGTEFAIDAQTLVMDWRQIGVDAQLNLLDSTELQNSVASHDYDAIVYGISIGYDPDVFVYWDSTQSDPRSQGRLNLSEYKSAVADNSLEGSRTRIDATLRVIKMKSFLQAWQKDAPALGLYQPRFLYITNGAVYGLNEHTLNNDYDRYDNVVNWEIKQAKVND